jgi:predicted nucleic acid-binding Zn ribbon protein
LRSRKPSEIRDVGSSIQQLVDELGIRQKIAEYDAVLQWESLVGEHIAKAATAVKIVKGVLFVKVKSSAWRNELSLRKDEIMSTLNTALGSEVVKDIRFQ